MKLSFVLALFLLPATSFAADAESVALAPSAAPKFLRHEISGGAMSSLSMSMSSSANGETSRMYSLGFNGGYDYALSERLQVGATFGTHFSKVMTNGGGGFSLTVGPTFNFGGEHDSLRNAAFVRLQTGIGYAAWYTTTRSLLGELSAGKRFSLGETVSYKPYASLNLSSRPRSTTLDFTIVPLSLSVLL